MATVFDLAEYILEKRAEMGEENVSTLKLQKLVYYSQAWNLAWDEKPIFDNDIEAWINGPVVKDLYYHHQGLLTVSAGFFKGNSNALSVDEKETVDAVLEAYGDLDPYSLVSLTHEERPWLDARGDLPKTARSNNVITQESMRDFYVSIL